jgi:transposase
MFIKTISVKNRKYLQLVESVRKGNKVRQVFIAHLGNVKQDQESLLKIASSIIKHCNEKSVIDSDSIIKSASEYGKVLVCEKLFKDSGLECFLGEKISQLKGKKKYYISLPHIKAMVYNRLCNPRSKYSILRWLEDVHIDGITLPEVVNEEEQKSFAEVCYKNMDFLIKHKEGIEALLFDKIKQLFDDDIEVIMYDITSVYFEGDGPQELAEFGHSRDEKRNNKQIVIGVVMANGFPIAYEIFRGSTKDSKTLQQIVEKLRQKYKIKRIVFVADSGLLTEDNMQYLEKNDYEYIICAKRRRSENWQEIFAGWEKNAKEIQDDDGEKILSWSENKKDGRRLILCESEHRLYHEQQMRESIMNIVRAKLQRLERMVKDGKVKHPDLIIKRAEKILNRKRAHWYFEYTVGKGKFTWQENTKRIEKEKFVEGKFFLITNNKEMKGESLILTYKDLWMIERGFRTLKNFIRVRPIFHWKKQRVEAHVLLCMISLFMEKLLQKKINDAKKRWSASRVLDSLRTIKIAKVQTGEKIETKFTTPGPIQRQMLEIIGIEKGQL